jgi:S1-C subfamily serine protease
MRRTAALGVVAALIGGGIVFGAEHATGLLSSARTSTPGSADAPGGASGSSSSPYSGGSGGAYSGGSGGAYSGGSGGAYSGGSGGAYSGGAFSPGSSSSGSSSSSSVAGSGGPSDVSAIAAKVAPDLVDIISTFNYQSESGAGTGIVLTSNGEVITNNHVVNGATAISVTDVGNGKTYTAKVVGYDSTDDIAVLQLQDASGLKTATIGNSSTATVGEPIVAIGNAGGTGGTPTSSGGSITALNQSVTASDELDGTNEQLTGAIGVNADVEPGDSGGSLVNSAGQVLGIDTAGSAGSSLSAYSGQSSTAEGFAIPINKATSIAQQIESGNGTSTIHVGATAFLGVTISSINSQNGTPGAYLGSGSSTSSSGVPISGVVSGGTAQQAGLAAGDVITSFNGQTVNSPSTLTELLVPLHPGDKVQIDWTDASGQSHTATVDLGSGPPA